MMGQDVIGHTVAPVAAGLCAAMKDGSMCCAGLKEPVRNDLGLQRCVAQSLAPGRATIEVCFRADWGGSRGGAAFLDAAGGRGSRRGGFWSGDLGEL